MGWPGKNRKLVWTLSLQLNSSSWTNIRGCFLFIPVCIKALKVNTLRNWETMHLETNTWGTEKHCTWMSILNTWGTNTAPGGQYLRNWETLHLKVNTWRINTETLHLEVNTWRTNTETLHLEVITWGIEKHCIWRSIPEEQSETLHLEVYTRGIEKHCTWWSIPEEQSETLHLEVNNVNIKYVKSKYWDTS